MRKRILLVNYPTEIEHNWGCKASCAGLMELIKEKYPGSLIRTHPIHFDTPDIEIPRDPSEFTRFAEMLAERRWKEYSDMDWADIVILDGEGSIHEFGNRKENDYVYLKLLGIYAAKKIFKKRVMIINHTVDFTGKEFGALITAVYPGCDYVSVREPLSQKKLEAISVDSVLTADTAFIYGGRKVDGRELRKRLSIPDKYYVFFLSQMIDAEPAFISSLCKAVWNMSGLPAVFIILSQKEKNIANIVNKSGIASVVIEKFIEPEEIIELLKTAEYCLSGRFHASIFSVLANTPFIGFRANTHKIAGLIEMLGYPFEEMLFNDGYMDKIIKTIEFIGKNRVIIASDLKEKAELMKNIVRNKTLKIPLKHVPELSAGRIISDESEYISKKIKQKLKY